MKTIAAFHPSSELYGADRILVYALKAFPTNIHKRVYLKSEGPLIKFIEEEVENVSVMVMPQMPIIYRKLASPSGLLQFSSWYLGFRKFLKQENKKYNFISAYVNTLSCSFILPILNKLNIQSFIHVHEIIESPKLIGKVTAQLCNRYAQKIVCVSDAVLKGMESYVPNIHKKAQVIHNGIVAINVDHKTENENLNFYLFGRIMPKKGQWFLLDALKLIPVSLLKGSKFILMGGVLEGHDHLLKELKQKINSSGLDHCVKIKGFAPCISEAMNDADVCLVPSIMKDPFPTTVLEAMSAGKPVIATNHGGAKEAIVHDKTGLLVQPDSPDGLASQITKLINNKNLIKEFGQEGLNRFNQHFTINHFKTNWLAFNHKNSFI